MVELSYVFLRRLPHGNRNNFHIVRCKKMTLLQCSGNEPSFLNMAASTGVLAAIVTTCLVMVMDDGIKESKCDFDGRERSRIYTLLMSYPELTDWDPQSIMQRYLVPRNVATWRRCTLTRYNSAQHLQCGLGVHHPVFHACKSEGRIRQLP
jgi:hypothetical protein